MLTAGGKGLLKGMENYGLPGSGMDLAGGPLSGVGLIEALFKKIGIFGNDKKEDERMDPTGNFTGPRY